MTYDLVEPSSAVAPLGREVVTHNEIVDPDAELVGRWQAGDASAFEALVRRHERPVFRLALRMLGNREEAEDVTQEALLSLHRHGHSFRRESRFSTFVYRVAVNAALNRRRSLGRRRSHLDAFAGGQAMGQGLPSTPRGPEDAVAGDEVRARVQRCLHALPEALRAPVVLFDIAGLSYGEIAEILDVAEGTVKSRIHRARLALRRELGELAREVGVER